MANHPTLSRRQFLRSGASPLPASVHVERLEPSKADLTAADFPISEVVLNGGLAPYLGPWGPEQAAHLLRRATFGVSKSQIKALTALGSAQKAVAQILSLPADPPAPPVNNYNGPDYTDPDIPLGASFADANYILEAEGYRIESWRGWWLDLMIEGNDIREKMTLFLHNLLATQTASSFWSRAVIRHNALLRKFALGNYKELVKRVTIDPHMLIFLNGVLNDVSAPDENYARELQELFTVGKDGSTYTEDDVVAAARVLTGWRIQWEHCAPIFYADGHDKGDKKFSAFYGNKVIKGGSDGERELDELLAMIFAKEEVALFVCRELYRFFVYYKIDATVEQDVIKPLAQIFRDNNYDLYPTLSALLNSEHFFDAYNKGCYIKTPVDILVGLMRNFNMKVPASTPYDEFLMRLYLNYTMSDWQMLPGDPPNVAGWQAFRQSPGYYRMWINGDTIRNRNIFSDVMCFYYYETDNDRLNIDVIGFAKQLDRPDDPNLLVEEALQLLMPMPIPPLKKWLLKSILLSGQASDHYWTDLWEGYKANPNDDMTKQMVTFRLSVLYKYIMNLAEYQLI